MFDRIAKLVMAAALALSIVPAQSNLAANRITGSWLISITVDGAADPFAIDMAIFHPDGTMSVISSERNAESNGTGSWQRTGDREFVSTHTQILYNEKGGFSGLAKVIAQMKVGDNGDTFSGRYRVEVSSATGRVLAKITGPISGKLVVPESL